MAIYSDIQNTFQNLMTETFSDIKVVGENERYKPELRVTYAQCYLLPASTVRETLGENGTFRYPGLFQVSFYVPAQTGTVGNDLVDRVMELVKSQPTYQLDDGTLHLQSASRLPAITQTDWFHIPVRISYVAYA